MSTPRSTLQGDTALLAPPAKLQPVSPTPDIPRRRVIVVSFWALILLSIPFWWRTTTIERLPLPSAEVQAWAERGPCFLRPPVAVSVCTTCISGAKVLGGAIEALRSELPTLPGAGCVDFRIGGLEVDDFDVYEIVLGGREEPASEGRRVKVPVSGAGDAALQKIKSEAAAILDIKSAESDPRVVKFASTYKLVFSLLNQESSTGDALLDWDVQPLLDRHLRPLLTSLAPLHNFTIETQIQYFAPLSIDVHQSDDGAMIEEGDLRAFVNSADWNMASSVTLDPVLHFIIYVPSASNRPMQIRTSSGLIAPTNAFITPQWGGVVIFNPPSATSPDLSDSFRLFEQQLQKLLGVPQSRHTVGSLAQWQVDALVRRRLGEATKESVDTLGAIVKLAESLPNMRVGKEVQRDVRLSLSHLSAARDILPTSSATALHHAATALQLASKAYFNPTMLSLLYFPDEHKYAVYTPLFGPVAVPLLAALVKEWKEWKERKRKAKLEKEKQE